MKRINKESLSPILLPTPLLLEFESFFLIKVYLKNNIKIKKKNNQVILYNKYIQYIINIKGYEFLYINYKKQFILLKKQ